MSDQQAVAVDRGVYEGLDPATVALLEQCRFYLGDKNIDDPDAGLAYQVRQGWLDREGLEAIVQRQQRLVRLIQNDQFVP